MSQLLPDELKGKGFTDILKMFGTGLDHVEMHDSELAFYSMVKGSVSTILGLFNKILQWTTGHRSIFHWLYLMAYKAIIGAMHKHQLSVAADHGAEEAFYVLRFGPTPAGHEPRLQIITGTVVREGIEYRIKPTDSVLPHEHCERILKWYEERKSPSGDIAKLFVLGKRKDPADGQK
jgi:hypothetical protein